MKKIVMVLTALLLFSGCSPNAVIPIEGIYPIKLKTLTIFDFNKELQINYNAAELTDSKPDCLTVDFDYTKLNDYKFGSFSMGNNEKKVWFVMGKDQQGYWSDFYIDQNLDYHLTEKEKIKCTMNEGTYKDMKTLETITFVPVPIMVSYKGNDHEYQKKLYFALNTIQFVKNKKIDTLVRAADYSFLSGVFKVRNGIAEKLMEFRIIDFNGNGCFNDYGKDLLLVDVNGDGVFKKMPQLIEYFDATGPDNLKKQLRLVILPCPDKIAVTESSKEIDFTQLEPQSDKTPDPDSNKISVPESNKSSAPAAGKDSQK